MHKSILHAIALSLGAMLFAGCASNQACCDPVSAAMNHFQDWPAGSSPAEVGKRVTENFLARKLEAEQGKRPYIIYPEVITWYGSLKVAKLTGDTNLHERLVRKFDPLLTPAGAKMISPAAHMD